MRELGLEGSNLFEVDEWLVDHSNFVGIFFGYQKSYALNSWWKKWVDNILLRSSS